MPVQQRTRAWLSTATPQQITAALDAGELAELLGRRPPVQLDRQATEDDVAGMTPDEIAAAFEHGHLDELLGR
ncbi:hypothetical protein [Actinomadura sp. NEAU-AAG7]|uniref:hypothetical protein n=1 Tax=Actinomadura sp. NEAU-AAG7 TaxID=2839640 RepID=UPI001BE4BF9D|nr:hypothetical protein [Actinomadura sp. NEAU-AAG7]MBT2207028.1 hypothetical protein [Actinomadura sp. NEAU-AAG7]